MAKIKEVAVVPYQQHAYCDCGEELKATGTMLTSNPPQHQHKCPKCNKQYTLDQRYPTLVWKERKK